MDIATRNRILGIVSIFEGGAAFRYSTLTSAHGDTGGISGGFLQASRASGNFGKLLREYVKAGGLYIDSGMVAAMERRDPALDSGVMFKAFKQQWDAACKTDLMAAVQRDFFYRVYMAPAEAWCKMRGITEPLGIAIVFDSFIHGSFQKINKLVEQAYPPGQNEWDFCRAYITMRRQWLATHPNPLLQKCVYRMDEFQKLLDAQNWKLDPPLNIRGVVLTPNAP